MSRRWLLVLEVAILVTALTWVGVSLSRHADDREPSAVQIKVHLLGARNEATLFRTPAGSLLYRITNDDGRVERLTPEQFAERRYHEQFARTWAQRLLNITSPAGFLWVTLGLLGQLLFTGRMIVQWLVSEKHKRSIVPPIFWWMSLCGSTMLLVYFIWRQDAVGVLGQGTGWVIYVRNLLLIYRPHPDTTPAPSVAIDPAPEPEL